MFAREGCSAITITYLPQELEDAKDAQKMIQHSGATCNIFEADLMEEATSRLLAKSWLTITSRNSKSWIFLSTTPPNNCKYVTASGARLLKQVTIHKDVQTVRGH